MRGAGRGAGRGRGNNVLTRSTTTPADLERSILLEWREGSAQLQRVWRDENAPVSSWEGVTVGEDGRVVELYLDGKGLTSVPAALGRLTALQELDLNMNQLTSVPAAMGKLTALTRLGLGRNQLTSVPAELGGLTALEGLYLSWNQLTSVPAELGGLDSLLWLTLVGNPDLAALPEEVAQLSQTHGGICTIRT